MQRNKVLHDRQRQVHHLVHLLSVLLSIFHLDQLQDHHRRLRRTLNGNHHTPDSTMGLMLGDHRLVRATGAIILLPLINSRNTNLIRIHTTRDHTTTIQLEAKEATEGGK